MAESKKAAVYTPRLKALYANQYTQGTTGRTEA
jgi:hypothetical protein